MDLKEWTAYFNLNEVTGVTKPKPEIASTSDVTVLMETARPVDVNEFLQRQLDIPPADRVHVGTICYNEEKSNEVTCMEVNIVLITLLLIIRSFQVNIYHGICLKFTTKINISFDQSRIKTCLFILCVHL